MSSPQQDLEHKIEEENQEALTVTVEKLSKTIKTLIIAMVSITLLLDGMLNMIILPIIPEYVKYLPNAQNDTLVNNSTSSTKFEYSGSDLTIGFLFATKPLVQLIVNPFGGTLIDSIGYKIPMAVGLCIQFASTLTFALTNSFRFLFLARILQGIHLFLIVCYSKMKTTDCSLRVRFGFDRYEWIFNGCRCF